MAVTRTDSRQRSGRTWSSLLVLKSGLVARSLQGEECQTIVGQDRDRPVKALREQRISCQRAVGAESLALVGGFVGILLVTVCMKSVLLLQATQQCLLFSKSVIEAEVVSKLQP